MPDNDLVEVLWIDITHYDGSPSGVPARETVKKDISHMESLGYLLVNEEKVTIAGTRSEDDGEVVYDNILIFPRCVVKKIVNLTRGTEEVL